MKRLDISTFFGIAAALALFILAAIVNDKSDVQFFQWNAFAIVVGGTLALTIASFSVKDTLSAFALFVQTSFYIKESPHKAGISVLNIAKKSRKEGILSLQSYLPKIRHKKFLNRGLQMAIDGMNAEEIQPLIEQDMYATQERHNRGVLILKKAAEISPAMGLIGTLLGLIKMLGSLDDPATVGPAMALALLTTLYGAVFAYMICIPLASKLERNSKDEILIRRIYALAILSIARQENPRRLEMSINSIVGPSQQVRYFS